ncbi:MAG: hypothetical protein Q4B57_08665 [Eubacteriales bacterium]|nr:hypothetical protein [Eubacteriales bacterium]
MLKGTEGFIAKSGKRIVTALLTCLLVLGMFAAVQASEEDRMPDLDETKRSLTVTMMYADPNESTEKEIVRKVMPGVEVKLLKVADLKVEGGSANFTLQERFRDSGIELAGITAEESRSAAEKLAGMVTKEDAPKVVTTDAEGVAAFDGLEDGMYLVYQEPGANVAFRIDEITTMLISVPNPVKEEGNNHWDYAVALHPKTELDLPKNNGRIRVTKQLFDTTQNAAYTPSEGTELIFYVGLYADAACTKQVTGTTIQPLRFANTASATAEFKNLKTDETYYIAETDENGKLLTAVVKGDIVFQPQYPEGQSVMITRQKPEGEIGFRNTTNNLPVGYDYVGTLKITKKTLKGGKAYPTEQTFYAGIFSDSAFQKQSGEVISLKMDGKSSVSSSVSVYVGKEKGDSVTYYVTETDKNGKPLSNDKSQGFTFTVDKKNGKVTMSPSASEAEVVITNTFEDSSESSSMGSTHNKGGASSSGTTSSTSNRNVKTGDDTPIVRYVLLLVAAALLLGVSIRIRNRMRK